MADNISQKIEDIQKQLAKLQTGYASMATAMYDMFFNTNEKDVTLTIYDSTGKLVDVTIPNRAKDATDKVLYGNGDPNILEVEAKQVGVLYIDKSTEILYYYTNNGWIPVLSEINFEKGLDYLTPTSEAPNLRSLNIKNVMKGAALPVASGGTGVSSLGTETCIVKYIPAVTDEGEEITPAYFAPANGTADFISPKSFTGMICFALSNVIPEGYLVCDGARYSVVNYPELYQYLNRVLGTESEPGSDGVEYFEVPYLMGYYPYFTDLAERQAMTTQEPGLPNIKGQWVQEITGAEGYFTGAINIPMSNGKPIQVSGKTSAPGGYYDYLVHFDASKSNSLYSDDIVDEVRVRNIALVPIIKY